MNGRAIRIAVLVIFVAGAAAVALQIVRAEGRIAAEQNAAEEFDMLAQTIVGSLAELKAAQQAYVAVGQSESHWIEVVGRRVVAIREQLHLLDAAASVDGARQAVASAGAMLDRFVDMDRQAAVYARGGQRLLASDLIFSDGAELTGAAATHVRAASAQEAEVRQQNVRAERRHEASLLLWALTGGFLLLVLLASIAESRPRERLGEPPPAVMERARPEAPQLTAAALGPPELGASSSLDIEPHEPSTPANVPPQSARLIPDLRAAAELCTDLGRVLESQELPPLLERAATLLDASGIIVWLQNGAGGLHPVLAHGYPPQALERIGSIPPDADNATAAAYRAGRIHTVAGADGRAGAIVVPLISAGGCRGVMAAELNNGGEADASVQAIASILAAQLSTLVASVPPSAARSEAATSEAAAQEA